MSEEPQLRTESQVNLIAAFEQTARKFDQRVLFKGDGGQGLCFTYGEAAHVVRQLANGLASGEKMNKPEIGLIAENRPEWPLAYLAILAAGGTVVPIDANLGQLEIAHIVGHAGLRVVFASAKYEALLEECRAGLQIISFEAQSERSWKKLLVDEKPPVTPIVSKTAVLIYTSGTTGLPKAVELTHQNLLSNLDGIARAFKLDENDTFLSVLPLHHTFEATCGFLLPLMAGSTIVYARSLKSKEIIEDLRANRATIMAGVPLLFEKMYYSIQRGIKAAPPARRLMFNLFFALSSAGWKLGNKTGRTLFRPLREKAGLGSIRIFASGGAAMPPKINRFFNLIGFDFLQGYGLTETSPVLTVNSVDDITFESAGSPLHNVEVKIDKPDATGVGEIVVRGPNITPGYRDNPEQTAELIKNGWLYTGDLGCLKEGHLYITGRQKNVIVSAAGKNIYPEQLEEKLAESVCIAEAVVFGRRKGDSNREEVRALIVPDLEQLQAENGISVESPDMEKVTAIIAGVVREINQMVADYKRIVGFDLQLDELDKTSTKKVRRYVYK